MFTRFHSAVRVRSLQWLPSLAVFSGALILGGCASEVVSQEPVAASAVGADAVLAIVDGEELRTDDLAAPVVDQLALLQHQYDSQRYQLLEAGLEQAVRDRLITAEAEARGVEVEALMASEITSKISVTDAEVTTWFQLNQDRLQGRPLEMLKPAIQQFLWDQKQDELLTAFAGTLAEGRTVEYRLTPYRVALETEGHPTFGPANAPVTLVEFSDFECPFCGRFLSTLDQVKEAYEGRIRIVYRQFPLRQIHPNAQIAAEASLCAAEQDGFWGLHDLMFAEQDTLTADDLKEKAGRLGLDVTAFDACLASGKYQDQIEEDMRAGQRLGVDGTPALFVNGRPVEGGAVPFETLAQVIDEELERAGR